MDNIYIKPIDFDICWEKWKKEALDIKNNVILDHIDPQEFGSLIYFYFDSINNTKIHCRFYVNDNAIKLNRPIILLFHGAGSCTWDDHNIYHCLNWAKNDFCVIMMDCRNQGGFSVDDNVYDFMDRSYMCRGILSKETSYEKLLYLDAFKLLNITRDSSIEIFKYIYDKEIIVAGPSQGGQLSLAMASLSDIPLLCIPDIPSGCRIDKRMEGRHGKYNAYREIIDEYPEYKKAIYEQAAYFDVVFMTDNIKCPVYSSVGTTDDVCPMEFYIEGYEKIKSQKEVIYYEGYGHGGFEEIHFPKKLEYVLNYLESKNK